MKHYDLREIAEIRSGRLFKHRIEDDPTGEINVIQLKDVELGRLSIENCIKIKKKSAGSALIEPGDILFKAKSSKNEAAVFNLEKDKAITTNHYFVIHLKKDIANPEFVSSFINSKHGKRYFERVAGGSRIPVVNMKSLGELSVPLPLIDVQNKVVELVELHREEDGLVERIKKKRNELIGAVFDGLILGKLEVNK